MSTPEQQLNRITEKLQQLLKQHSAVRRENEKLREELKTTREKLTEQETHAAELRQQVGVLKMNTGGMSDADKKELEKKINAYLREIDRCIALLSE